MCKWAQHAYLRAGLAGRCCPPPSRSSLLSPNFISTACRCNFMLIVALVVVVVAPFVAAINEDDSNSCSCLPLLVPPFVFSPNWKTIHRQIAKVLMRYNQTHTPTHSLLYLLPHEYATNCGMRRLAYAFACDMPLWLAWQIRIRPPVWTATIATFRYWICRISEISKVCEIRWFLLTYAKLFVTGYELNIF